MPNDEICTHTRTNKKGFTQGLSLFQKAERKSYKNQRNVYYK